MLARSSLTFVAALCVTGCASSSYLPTNSTRVSMAVEGGGVGYYKSGKKYDHLVDAVDGNPQALEEARTAHSIEVTSGWLFVGSLGLDAAGLSMLLAGQNDTVRAAGLSTIGAALIVEAAGFIVATHAVPHKLDAINIYNDDLETKAVMKRRPPVPAAVPTAPASETR
ncbi:MAG TPA: hypothetical protein VHC69_18065 [Polyangiaceae bacterium]|nr:hypothetical protein [Polyangiaceae bacterium]